MQSAKIDFPEKYDRHNIDHTLIRDICYVLRAYLRSQGKVIDPIFKSIDIKFEEKVKEPS